LKNNVLQEISKWKLEAKSEDYERYFYYTPEVKNIEDGSTCYAIGRKGTGKTAISNYLIKNCNYNKFSEGLNFQNFPFNDLYALSDNKYTAPNQYITLWKFVIYSSILKMMSENDYIDINLRAILKEFFPKGIEQSLSKRLKEWTSRKIGFKGLGFGIDYSKTKTISDNPTSWIERVDILEEIINKYIDTSKYFIIFDELDEDYKNIEEPEIKSRYFDLLTSLFKAVHSIKSFFLHSDKNIFPIIFLRDDIYENIMDSDKSKWMDFGIYISWGLQKLKELIAYRISKAINPEGDILSYIEAWKTISSSLKLNKNNRTYEQIHYIWLLTLNRPRDIIQYLKICSEYAWRFENKVKFDSENIKKSERKYSYFLKGEIRDELYSTYPDINNIFDVISDIKKQYFKKNEFIKFYHENMILGKVKDRNPEIVLSKLFEFSVIGNMSKSKSIPIFKYRNSNARLFINELLCVHRGLFKSLL